MEGVRLPRYFFHIRDSLGLVPDTEGMDLLSLNEAMIEAKASARSIAEERKYMPIQCCIEVRDEEGLAIAVVPVFRPS